MKETSPQERTKPSTSIEVSSEGKDYLIWQSICPTPKHDEMRVYLGEMFNFTPPRRWDLVLIPGRPSPYCHLIGVYDPKPLADALSSLVHRVFPEHVPVGSVQMSEIPGVAERGVSV